MPEHEPADVRPDPGVPGLVGLDDLVVAGSQQRRERRHLGGLAGALAALERHEHARTISAGDHSLRPGAARQQPAGAQRLRDVRADARFLGAGPLARLSASSSAARSTVSDSTESPLRRVAFVSPSVT